MPSSPRRRTTDERPRGALIAPTPGSLAPAADPGGVLRSIDLALGAARKGRRHLTLVSISLRADDPAGSLLDQAAVLVRRTVRSTDGIWADGPDSLMVLLADVDGPSVEPVIARIRLRLKDALPGRVRLGRAAAPPGIGAGDLAELARADRDR